MSHLLLPAGQNWSCHRCTDCCRHHVIEISASEKERIEQLPWEAGDPLRDKTSAASYGGGYRLVHGTDGACIFLGEDGLCRIHSKFGGAAKPLACRIFPYALHPAGKSIAVSLRFSCPSVTANNGRPLGEQVQEVREIARWVVPPNTDSIPAPAILDDGSPLWPDFSRFVKHLARFFSNTKETMSQQLLNALRWVELIEKAQFSQITGEGADEILGVLAEAAREQAAGGSESPSRIGRSQFRTLVYEYARKDTVRDLNIGLGRRLKRVWAALRFSRGAGLIPALSPEWREVPFELLEKPFGVPDEVQELMRRYFRVKIEGLHFCGLPYYNLPLVEGFRHLALVFPAALFLARWRAATQGRSRMELSDAAFALSRIDHHHGYSPGLGTSNARRRVRLLVRNGDLGKLIGWYAR